MTKTRDLADLGGGFIQAGTGAVQRTVESKLQDMVSVKDFGAVGDGVADDTAAIQACFTAAATNKKDVYFPDGTFLLNSFSSQPYDGFTHPSAVFLASNNPVSILCAKSATIKAGPALSGAAPGAVFWFRSQSGLLVADGSVTWRGGTFDLSALTQTTTGCCGIRFEQKLKEVRVDGVTFDHGVQTPSGDNPGYGGGDESITIRESDFASVTNCSFLGAPDIGIYLSGDSNVSGGTTSDSPRYGRHAVISSCYFYRCSVGVSAKRYFKKTIISNNIFFECGTGVLLGTTDGYTDNNGKRIIVSNNYLSKIQVDPLRLDNTENAVVTGNEIVDYRRWVSDGTTESAVSVGNIGAGVKLSGSTQCTVTGNVIGFQDWTAVSTADKYSAGVTFRTLNGVGSSNSVVSSNVIYQCYTPFYFSNESSGNIVGDNKLQNNTISSVLGSGDNTRNIDLQVDKGTGLKYLGTRTFAATGDDLEIARFAGAVSAVNSVQIANSITGSPVLINARGSDTFIDLQLSGKGSQGYVRFGTHTSSIDAPISGYITIKDASGTERKLAVIT